MRSIRKHCRTNKGGHNAEDSEKAVSSENVLLQKKITKNSLLNASGYEVYEGATVIRKEEDDVKMDLIVIKGR